MIKFLCPNGHELSAATDLVGKPGKCPKCSVRFVVPDPHAAQVNGAGEEIPTGQPEEQEGAEEAPDFTEAAPESFQPTADSDVQSPASPGAPSPTSVSEGQADSSLSAAAPAVQAAAGQDGAGDNMIVFLCPNGHRLNGPASLQGKAGQCPHCGAKFRIPTYDEESPEQQPAPPGEADSTAAGQPDAGGQPPTQPIETQPGPTQPSSYPPQPPPLSTAHDAFEHGLAEEYVHDFGAPFDEEQIPEGVEISEGQFEQPSLGASAARILSYLWSVKNGDWQIELHTADETLTGQHFAPGLSRQGFAVLASQEKDQSYTIIAAPWEEVKRIRIAEIKELPSGFE